MRLGIRAHDLKKDSIENMVKKMSEDGFRCTQLALRKAISEFNNTPEAMTPGMAMYLKEIFQKNNVDISVLGCYLNLGTPDQGQLEDILKTYKAHIRFASILGCGVVGTETGAVNTEYKFEPENHSEKALDYFIENLKIVIDYAEKMGVIFAIEPVYKHIVCNNERTRKVLDAINSPNLQVILDPVNLLSVDNYTEQDSIVKQAFELYGDEIAVIHCKDFKIENDDIISIPSGTGEFHYDVLLPLIEKKKPHIHVLLENTKPENAVKTKEFMQGLYEDIRKNAAK